MNWLESCFVSHLESALLQLWVMSSLESAFALSLSLVEASFESYRPWNLLLLYLWVLSRPALSLVVLGICFCFILESCRGHLWVLSSLESSLASQFGSCPLLSQLSLWNLVSDVLLILNALSWSAGGGICFWAFTLESCQWCLESVFALCLVDFECFVLECWRRNLLSSVSLVCLSVRSLVELCRRRNLQLWVLSALHDYLYVGQRGSWMKFLENFGTSNFRIPCSLVAKIQFAEWWKIW